MVFTPRVVAETAIKHGFKPVPHFKTDEGDWKTRKFINPQTDTYGYPANHKAWSKPDMPMVSLVLLNTLLVDIDGNKGDDVSVDELKLAVCEKLGIDEFDLDMSEFQSNAEGDSLHYLFRLPADVPYDTISQSNDGKAIKRVDFKTGRQLVHIKRNKTTTWMNVDELIEVPETNLLEILKPNGANADDFENLDACISDETSRYGYGALREINNRATAFVESGERNSCLAAAVVSIYELVAGGEIAHTDAKAEVDAIVSELGIEDESDTKTTIEFNMAKGLKQPKSAPKTDKTEAIKEKKKTLKDDVHRTRAKQVVKMTKRFINERISFDAKIDLDIVHMIIKSSFWQPKESRLHTINTDNNRVMINETDAHVMLNDFFGNPMANYDYLCQKVDGEADFTVTERREIKNALIRNILTTIKAYNQRLAVGIEVDMFSDHTHFEFTSDRAIIKHVHEPLFAPHPIVDEVAIGEYKQHFPQIDEMLDMLVAARFASSRKKAYVWLKAPSDWGKDFFRVALGSISVEMSVKEIEKTLEGGAVGKSPEMFYRTFVMVTNEFKNVKSELKQLEDSIMLSAKYQLEARVPLYTKLFMSAEGVDSLVGEYGVESQFANRFSLIEVDGNINKLPSFTRLGGNGLLNVVKTYCAARMNDAIERYRKMGLLESMRQADLDVLAFHKKHSIGNKTKSIDESLSEVAQIVREQLVTEFSDTSECDGTYMYLKSAKTRIKGVLFNSGLFDRSEAATLKYKTDALVKIISDGDGVGVYRFGGKLVKALRLPLVDTFDILD